jgi:phosphohistidine phosphatase
MKIYIIRHGKAIELDEEISDDSYRYLSIHGKNHCKIVAMKLKDMRTEFDMIFTSPLVRAVQTAETIANVLKYDKEIKTAIELIGGTSFNRFKQFIKKNSRYEKIAVVGHAPDVNYFTMNLMSEEQRDNIQCNFKNASVCLIDFNIETDIGKIIWYLDSESMKVTEY